MTVKFKAKQTDIYPMEKKCQQKQTQMKCSALLIIVL